MVAIAQDMDLTNNIFTAGDPTIAGYDSTLSMAEPNSSDALYAAKTPLDDDEEDEEEDEKDVIDDEDDLEEDDDLEDEDEDDDLEDDDDDEDDDAKPLRVKTRL